MRSKLPKRRKWKTAKMPKAIPIVKAKTKIDRLQLFLKIRPLISQYKHPVQASLKLASRAIKLLQQIWRRSDSYRGFEMSKMNELREVVERVQNKWKLEQGKDKIHYFFNTLYQVL